MRLTRHAVTLATAVGVAAIAPSITAQQQRIGVVDLPRAMGETEDGRRAKAQIKKLFKARQKTLDDRTSELKALKEDIERQRQVLSQAALQKRMEEYQQKFVELQSTYVDYQRELAEKEVELTGVIVERMRRILRRIGQAEGYTLIMERNEAGVVWVPTNLDLTDVVIQRYNAGEGRDGEGEAPAGGGGGAKNKNPTKNR